ncbi:Krueppel homolog 2 isoform X2 [Ctenocephalides felis]|uniref:Krueppel homolog 2 isoform X2 n=1 Tax=Ctenocephalides felis TaxID=7515 RepID=UPI000E6E3D27|nr:Krueppel homolog 2 isoform X2 [Ctenocephalides felis]
MAENQERDSREQPRGADALMQHVAAHKVDVGLWTIRLLTIIFTIGYIIPIFSSAESSYYKAILANAATSALRLHQRLPRVSISRQFLAQLFLEDSCHYLLFSLIFLYVSPVLLVLLPIVLFAALHSASYSLTLLDTLGQNSWWGARLMISLIEFQSRNILRLASFSEIMIMPLTVILIFFGRASLFTPLMYYHFLTLRYASRRNPYTRNMFYELRLSVESIAAKPTVPDFVRNAIYTGVTMVSRLAPVEQPVQ